MRNDGSGAQSKDRRQMEIFFEKVVRDEAIERAKRNELHQLALTVTEEYVGVLADDWRLDTKSTIIQLIHEMVASLRDGRHAGIVGDECGACWSMGDWKIPMTLVGLLPTKSSVQ